MVHFRFLFICCCFLFLGQATAQEKAPLDPLQSWELTQAKWSEIAHFAGRFRVVSPGPFQEKVDSMDTPLGQLFYHTLYLAPQTEKTENEFYMVSYVDYPEGTVHQDSLELIGELLNETQAAAVESVRGELLFSQDGYQHDFPFRYWRIDYLNGRASIRTKAIIAGNRFYTVQTVTRQEYGMNHSTDRFIDSFEVF